MNFLKPIFVLFIFTLGACTKDELHYQPVNSDLELTIEEVYPNNQVTSPVLKLAIKTKEVYGCQNFQLATKQSVRDGIMKVEIVGYYGSGICMTALGPATTSIVLDENVQKISMSLNGETDDYSIDINQEKVAINAAKPQFSYFDYPEYYRYPVNSFALICQTPNEDSVICSQFKKVLLDNLSLQVFTFSGLGKIPYPNMATSYAHPEVSYFKYQTNRDLSKAGDLLQSFCNSELSDKQGVTLSIIGWNNTCFRNSEQLR